MDERLSREAGGVHVVSPGPWRVGGWLLARQDT